MGTVKFEIYLEDNFRDRSLTRIDIFSHIKNEWVLNSIIPAIDVFMKLEALTIKREVSLVHVCESHFLFPVLTHEKWSLTHFAGMSGEYKTLDDCIYELEYKKSAKPPKSERVLTARKIKSSLGGEFEPFQISEENVLRNVRFGSWKRN